MKSGIETAARAFEEINRFAVILALVCAFTAFGAAAEKSMPLIDFGESEAVRRCVPSIGQVTFKRSGEAAAPALVVNIAPGEDGYPGVGIKPKGQAWDLSRFGHVEARIKNTGRQRLDVNLRVDNVGDWRKAPWNTERVFIQPGETGVAKVIFGYQYGMKPGFKLDSSKVVQVLIFTGKVTQPVSFRIESLVAMGSAGEKPLVDPKNVRISPVDGYLLGGGVKIDAAKQLEAKDGAVAKVVTQSGRQALRLTYPANKDAHQVLFQPPIGRWNLTQACEVRVTVKNVGATPITPGVQVTSDKYHGTRTPCSRMSRCNPAHRGNWSCRMRAGRPALRAVARQS